LSYHEVSTHYIILLLMIGNLWYELVYVSKGIYERILFTCTTSTIVMKFWEARVPQGAQASKGVIVL